MKKSRNGIVMLGLILLAGMMVSANTAPAENEQPTMFPWSNSFFGSTEIKAPVEKVFAYLSDPRHMTIYYPGINGIDNVQGRGLGLTYHWSMEDGGQKFTGRDVYVDFIPNRKIVDAAGMDGGGYAATFTLIFHPLPKNRVKLTIVIQDSHALPAGAEKDHYAMDQQLINTLLKNIKTEMEKKPASAKPEKEK